MAAIPAGPACATHIQRNDEVKTEMMDVWTNNRESLIGDSYSFAVLLIGDEL